jgi:broad specificity phosphatase PhoE
MVVRTALLASPGGLIAVSHRYPLRALLSRIIGLDEAGAMVDALGNGDTVEMECHGEALLEDARLYRLGAP